MKYLFSLLMLTVPAYAGNSVTINSIGNSQNIQVYQYGYNHTANISLVGNNPPPVIITQTGNGKSISIDITCAVICPANPVVINE